MRKHLEQNYETVSKQAPPGKYVQDSRASARRQTSTPHVSQWLSSVKNSRRCLCARMVFSVTKAGQTDSNAKNPEWLTLGLRLCLHLGKWVVCSGRLMAFGHSSWMNVERRLLRNDPRTPTVLRLFSRFSFKGFLSASESDPGEGGGFFLT